MKILIAIIFLVILLSSTITFGQEQLTSFDNIENSTLSKAIQNVDGLDYLISRKDQGITIDKLLGQSTSSRVVISQRPANPKELKFNILSDCIFGRYLVEVYKTELYVFDIVQGEFLHNLELSSLGVENIIEFEESNGVLYLYALTSNGLKFISYDYIENEAQVSSFNGDQYLTMSNHFGYLYDANNSHIKIVDFSLGQIIDELKDKEIEFVKTGNNGFGAQIIVGYSDSDDIAIINHKNEISYFSCSLPNLDSYDEIIVLDKKVCLNSFEDEGGHYLDVYDLESCSFIINRSIGHHLKGYFFHHKYFGDDFLMLDLGRDFEANRGVRYFIQLSTQKVMYRGTYFVSLDHGNVVSKGDCLYMLGGTCSYDEGNAFCWQTLWKFNKVDLSTNEKSYPPFNISEILAIGDFETENPVKVGIYINEDSLYTCSYNDENNSFDIETRNTQHQFKSGIKKLKDYAIVNDNIFYYSNDNLYRTSKGETTEILKSVIGSDFIVLEDEVVTVNKVSNSNTQEVRFNLENGQYSSSLLEFGGKGLTENNLVYDRYIFGFGRLGNFYDVINRKFRQIYLALHEIVVNGNTMLIRGEDYPIEGYYLQNLSTSHLEHLQSILNEPYPMYPDGSNGYYLIQNLSLPYQVLYIDEDGVDVLYETHEEIDENIYHQKEKNSSCLIMNISDKAVCLGEKNGDIRVFEINNVKIEDLKFSNGKALITTSLASDRSKYLFNLTNDPEILLGDVNDDVIIKFISNNIRNLCIGEGESTHNIYIINEESSSLILLSDYGLEQNNYQNSEVIFALDESKYIFPLDNGIDGNELYIFNVDSIKLKIIYERLGDKKLGVDPLNMELTDSYLYFTAIDDFGKRQWFRIELIKLTPEEEVFEPEEEVFKLKIVPNLTDNNISVSMQLKELRIYNQMGEMLLGIEDYYAYQKIDVSQFLPEIYVIVGITQDNKQYSGKFVKIGK